MAEEFRHIAQERGITKIALMRGDEELSRTLVVPMQMRIGRAVLHMDGIGGVATPEEHRWQGYSRRVLEEAVRFMMAGDAVLATLYGIPHFYPKYGFATLGPEYVIRLLSLVERNQLPDRIAARPGRPGDLPALQRLYLDETGDAYGALVRDDDWWTWGEMGSALESDQDDIRVLERDGRIVAYAWRGCFAWWMQHWARDAAPALRIAEAFAVDSMAAEATLAMCRMWATDLGFKQCELGVPTSCRVGEAAMLQEAHVIHEYHDEAEFMGRATGLVALMRALHPELEARWQERSVGTASGSVRFQSGTERVTITADSGGVEVSPDRPGDVTVEMGPGEIARLVMGGFPTRLTLERAGVPQAACPMLSLLFPYHVPYIYPVDRF